MKKIMAIVLAVAMVFFNFGIGMAAIATVGPETIEGKAGDHVAITIGADFEIGHIAAYAASGPIPLSADGMPDTSGLMPLSVLAPHPLATGADSISAVQDPQNPQLDLQGTPTEASIPATTASTSLYGEPYPGYLSGIITGRWYGGAEILNNPGGRPIIMGGLDPVRSHLYLLVHNDVNAQISMIIPKRGNRYADVDNELERITNNGASTTVKRTVYACKFSKKDGSFVPIDDVLEENVSPAEFNHNYTLLIREDGQWYIVGLGDGQAHYLLYPPDKFNYTISQTMQIAKANHSTVSIMGFERPLNLERGETAVYGVTSKILLTDIHVIANQSTASPVQEASTSHSETIVVGLVESMTSLVLVITPKDPAFNGGRKLLREIPVTILPSAEVEELKTTINHLSNQMDSIKKDLYGDISRVGVIQDVAILRQKLDKTIGEIGFVRNETVRLWVEVKRIWEILKKCPPLARYFR